MFKIFSILSVTLWEVCRCAAQLGSEWPSIEGRVTRLVRSVMRDRREVEGGDRSRLSSEGKVEVEECFSPARQCWGPRKRRVRVTGVVTSLQPQPGTELSLLAWLLCSSGSPSTSTPRHRRTSLPGGTAISILRLWTTYSRSGSVEWGLQLNSFL